MLPILFALTVIFACFDFIDWVSILFTWLFFTPVFIDLLIMAFERKRQKKITAIKYLINLCVYIDTIQKDSAEVNEKRKNFDMSKVISKRERLFVVENKLTEPLDIGAMPIEIFKQQSKEIITQFNILFNKHNASLEYERIQNTPKYMIEIIKKQSTTIKITEQEKILNHLQFNKIGL
jgi:hypothetical protein